MKSFLIEADFSVSNGAPIVGMRRAAFCGTATGTSQYAQINTPDTASRYDVTCWLESLGFFGNTTFTTFTALPRNDQLPEGWSWGATYWPTAVLYSRNGTNQMYAVGDAPLASPMDAYEAAQAAIAAGVLGDEVPSSRSVAPWFVCVEAGQQPHPSYRFTAPEVVGQLPSLNTATDKAVVIPTGCSLCGFPGHNSRTCTRTDRTYDKVGIELEGRYRNLRGLCSQAERQGLTYCGDGSIRRGLQDDCVPQEFQTKPAPLVNALRQVVGFYPDQADHSCGLHVHVSFKDETHFSLLCTEEFYSYFRTRWLAWGAAHNLHPDSEFYQRLNGKNDYCGVNSLRENPFNADRYMQLNFRAYEEHKTLECRLLPMFRDAKLSVSAIQELLTIYEDWIGGACDSISLPSYQVSMSQAEAHEYGIKRIVESEIDISFPDQYNASIEIDIPDFAPVPEGMRRVVMTPTQLAQLNTLLAA